MFAMISPGIMKARRLSFPLKKIQTLGVRAEFPRILFVLRFWFRVGQERSSYSQKMSWSHMALNRHREPAVPTPPTRSLAASSSSQLLTTTQALGC